MTDEEKRKLETKFIAADILAATMHQLPKGSVIYTNDVNQLAVYLDGEYIGYITFWKGNGYYVQLS